MLHRKKSSSALLPLSSTTVRTTNRTTTRTTLSLKRRSPSEKLSSEKLSSEKSSGEKSAGGGRFLVVLSISLFLTLLTTLGISSRAGLSPVPSSLLSSFSSLPVARKDQPVQSPREHSPHPSLQQQQEKKNKKKEIQVKDKKRTSSESIPQERRQQGENSQNALLQQPKPQQAIKGNHDDDATNDGVFYRVLHPPAATKNLTSVSYHLIFSTGCSSFQDWQSYMFFYYVYRSGQPGQVTRIVSGCKTLEDESRVRTWFQEAIVRSMLNGTKDSRNGQENSSSPRFHLHFTPDYGKLIAAQEQDQKNHKKQPYKYYNKPWGTKHWMEHVLGYTFETLSTETKVYRTRNVTIHTTRNRDNPVHDDTIVILLDPDQIILQPFEHNDFTQDIWKSFPSAPNLGPPRTSIVHGGPMAQMYGFGIQWKTKINVTELLGPLYYSSKSSPIEALSFPEARQSYVVGPPYIATARDLYAIVRQWSYFVPRVHDQYPELLAEMFAYSLAAAHLRLPHQTAQSFMVSAIDATNSEAWPMLIDPMMNPEGRHEDQNNKNESSSNNNDNKNYNQYKNYTNNRFHLEAICANNVSFLQQEQNSGRLVLPRVFHYCQRYNWGPFYFFKYDFSSDFISSCTSPLLAEPPAQLLQAYDNASMLPQPRSVPNREFALRQTYAVCTIIHALNNAARFYKHHNNNCLKE